MYTIPQLLDLAKKKNKLTSDRQLATSLGLAHLHPYRTKGVIPNDLTALKLADLCGLDAKEVLLTCHMCRIRQIVDGAEVEDVYFDILKIVRKSAAAILIAVSLGLLSPAPASASDGLSPIQNHGIIYIMRRSLWSALRRLFRAFSLLFQSPCLQA